jgi:D-amino-acid dehydrogenase
MTTPTADLVVVGAGIVGLSTAYEAAGRGLRVTIVDGRHRGWATDAGAGIVNPLDLSGGLSDVERGRIALAGPEHYRELLDRRREDGESDVGFERVGQIVVAGDDDEETVLGQLAEGLTGKTAPSLADCLGEPQRITAADATASVPYLAADVRALFLPGVARVDGRRMASALRGAAARRGVRRRDGIARIAVSDGRAVGVDVDGDRIASGSVVVASGAWLGEDPSLRALDHAVRPVRGQIVHLAYPHGPVGRTPIVSSLAGPYVLAFDPDRVVTGATHEAAGFDYRVTAGGVAAVLADGLRLAPGLADASMVETRVGFRPVSADGVPIVGPVPGIDGLVVATGLGAHGLTLGPVVGAIAARIAVGLDPEQDVAALHPGRFLAPARI